ncbi:hypothetical protein [Helicobacter bizzozeronii]|nr:hypothetical protein [Helicobacter bizzozeronii]
MRLLIKRSTTLGGAFALYIIKRYATLGGAFALCPLVFVCPFDY